MKLFRRLIRFFKRCGIAVGVLMIGGHMFNSFLLSSEARALTNQEKSVDTFMVEPRNIFEAIGQQIEGDKEAIERFRRNRDQAVMHRAYQIEQRKIDIERMEEQGFVLNGNLIEDAITNGRYKMRQLYLQNDWSLGSLDLVTEEEMMRIVDIRNKIIEGVKLTDEEKSFYATINGTRNKYCDEKAKTDEMYGNYSATDQANVEVFGDSVPKPIVSIQGNRTLYIFSSQNDLIEGIGAYMSKIVDKPDGFIVRLKNQRTTLINHFTLNEKIIDIFNERGIAIKASPIGFDETAITFKKGGVLDNQISSLITPYKDNGLLDYIIPSRRDARELEEAEKIRQQREIEEMNAATAKEVGIFETIKTKVEEFTTGKLK